MEDLDGMIMETLRKFDCSFCNEVDSLSLMGLNDIVEATVKLLWACDSKNQERIPSYTLPQAMTVKYKAATAIANAIKELGIREEVGYQTLLYPNVYEIRQILISLIEKLPKQAITTDDYKSPLDQIKARIGEQIKTDLKAPKYPCYCRYLTRANGGSKWHLKSHDPEFFKFSTSSNDFRSRICSALEGHVHNDFPVDKLTFKQSSGYRPPIREKLLKINEPSKPPPLPPKPKSRTLPVESTDLQKLQDQNSTLKLKIETKSEQLEDTHALLHSMESEIDFNTAEFQSRDEKLLQILKDPESQFASLQKFIDQASSRRHELEQTFEEWKNENLPELERLRQKTGQIMTDVQIQEAKKAFEQLKRSIAEQTHTLHKLQKQANRGNVSELDSSERTKFLSRIMYLVKSVNAQKEEIMRSFQACQTLEKERHQLNGNLDRTFTVINNWLNLAAENDMILRKAHNLLVRMHSQCEMITQSIQSIFNLNHSSGEFQDQIELLKQQQVDSALDQILTDLLRVRQENDEIRQRLNQKR